MKKELGGWIKRGGLAGGAIIGGAAIACSDGGSDATTAEPTATRIELTQIPSQTAGLTEAPTIAPTPSPVITEAPATPEPTPAKPEINSAEVLNRIIGFFEGNPPEGFTTNWDLKKLDVLEGTPGGNQGYYDIRQALEVGDKKTAFEMLSYELFEDSVIYGENFVNINADQIEVLDPQRLLIPQSSVNFIFATSAEGLAKDILTLKYSLE